MSIVSLLGLWSSARDRPCEISAIYQKSYESAALLGWATR